MIWKADNETFPKVSHSFFNSVGINRKTLMKLTVCGLALQRSDLCVMQKYPLVDLLNDDPLSDIDVLCRNIPW
ncbi:hypothetical protein F2Q69_00062278 [Brassica cretica]|uniref:Uncharacterized protein n=1 Tax=Brassica cretica TaxID=69181 RepID=A0A8S9RCG6_BRACR|nr:hypothetical protein F2Q69_00062278 [Brassica cretica]